MPRDAAELTDAEAALIKAQMLADVQQMPVLYCAIGASSAMLGMAYWDKAPLALVAGVPAAFICFACVRLATWAGRMKDCTISLEDARRLLCIANVFAPLITVAFLFWGLALYSYGDEVSPL